MLAAERFDSDDMLARACPRQRPQTRTHLTSPAAAVSNGNRVPTSAELWSGYIVSTSFCSKRSRFSQLGSAPQPHDVQHLRHLLLPVDGPT